MKSLFVTLTLKRKLCLLLSVVLILTLFPVYAFADDPEESNSSGDSDVITDEMVDSELLSIANNLYEIQLLNDSRSTTYTATDIYNFMVNHFLMGGAQNGYMYQIYSFVTSLNTKVQAIMTYANSIREYTELIHDNITGDNTPITLYDLIGDHLGNIANMLGVTEGNTTLSTAELLLLINNTIDDSYLALGNIQTTLDSIQNNIALLYAVMTDIAESNNDIVTQTTTMNANMQTMIARLQSLQDDYNLVNWTNLDTNANVTGFSTSLDNLINNTYDVTTGWKNSSVHIFFKLSLPAGLNYYRLSLAFYTNNGNKNISGIVNFYNPDTNKIIDSPIYYNIVPTAGSTTYIDFYNITSGNYYVELIFPNTYRVNTLNSRLYYISNNHIDYYYLINYISNLKYSNAIDKFVNLYASDDLIAAKQDQQGYEDQAIEDFTGSGSAAAKGSDLTDMKSISGALKQGLSSGGSVSNALSPFNTNSGFWDWFSQSNYDDINNLSTPLLRSGYPSNDPEIIDFYNDNQLTLQGLLSGGNN